MEAIDEHHYLYQIDNILHNKTYIGIHSTKNMSDRYMGSGTYLIAAMKKYGRKHFKRRIIAFFGSRKEVLKAERLVVNKEFVNRKDTYNIQLGGNKGGKAKEIPDDWIGPRRRKKKLPDYPDHRTSRMARLIEATRKDIDDTAVSAESTQISIDNEIINAFSDFNPLTPFREKPDNSIYDR